MMEKASYIEHDGVADREHMTGVLQDVSAEQLTIAVSMLTSLTKESKFLLYVLLNSPSELCDMTSNGIRNYLKSLNKNLKDTEEGDLSWKPGEISIMLTELKTFTKELFS